MQKIRSAGMPGKGVPEGWLECVCQETRVRMTYDDEGDRRMEEVLARQVIDWEDAPEEEGPKGGEEKESEEEMTEEGEVEERMRRTERMTSPEAMVTLRREEDETEWKDEVKKERVKRKMKDEMGSSDRQVKAKKKEVRFEPGEIIVKSRCRTKRRENGGTGTRGRSGDGDHGRKRKEARKKTRMQERVKKERRRTEGGRLIQGRSRKHMDGRRQVLRKRSV